MTLECKVISVRLGDKFADGKERIDVDIVQNGRKSIESLSLRNDDNLKLGDRFTLASQPMQPRDVKEM